MYAHSSALRPGVLPMVAEKVAELKMGRVSTDEVLAAARDNARRVLFAPAAAPR